MSQGPSLVPWGTPDGTAPYSEKQSLESCKRCRLSIGKSQTQRATPLGMRNPRILAARVLWSTRSKAFLTLTLGYLNLALNNPAQEHNTHRRIGPVRGLRPGVHHCNENMKSWRFWDCAELVRINSSKTVGPIYLLTMNSSTNLDRAKVKEMGLICLVMMVTGFTFISGETSASFHDRGSFCSANDEFTISQTGEVRNPAYSRRSQLLIHTYIYTYVYGYQSSWNYKAFHFQLLRNKIVTFRSTLYQSLSFDECAFHSLRSRWFCCEL